jgi:hypothetical protein
MSFWQQKPAVNKPKVKAEPLVIKPDYRVAAGFFLGAFVVFFGVAVVCCV